MRSRFYERELVDSIFQQDPREHLGLETAYAFMNVFGWMLDGMILQTTFDVDLEPIADRHLNELREPLLQAMNDMIPTELSLRLGNEQEGPDGWLRFPEGRIRFDAHPNRPSKGKEGGSRAR